VASVGASAGCAGPADGDRRFVRIDSRKSGPEDPATWPRRDFPLVEEGESPTAATAPGNLPEDDRSSTSWLQHLSPLREAPAHHSQAAAKFVHPRIGMIGAFA